MVMKAKFSSNLLFNEYVFMYSCTNKCNAVLCNATYVYTLCEVMGTMLYA